MAKAVKKTKKTSTKSKSDSNVVRIRANSAPASKNVESAEVAEAVIVAPVKSKGVSKTKTLRKPKVKLKTPRFLKAVGSYFKGAWVELRQVRWPNRRATWSLTGAVILFSGFFIVLVLLLDAGFKYLFQLILGK